MEGVNECKCKSREMDAWGDKTHVRFFISVTINFNNHLIPTMYNNQPGSSNPPNNHAQRPEQPTNNNRPDDCMLSQYLPLECSVDTQ